MKIESLNLSSKEPIVTKLKQLEKEMQTVVLAEDIALVRCELTTKIMEENLPSENWAKVTFEILKKYPQLESYKNIFLKTMEEAQKTNNTINQIWKSKILKTTRTDNKNYELSSFDVANQKNSKNLFEEIFQKKPKGEIRAVKGRLSLIFEVTKIDLDQFRDEKEKKSTGGFFTKSTPAGIPIIVVLAENQNDHFYTAHEVQHLQNNLLQSGIDIFFHFYPKKLTKQLQKTKKRMTDKIVIENNAKDEILSYATTLEIIENEKTYAKKHGINFNINDTPEKLFFQEVKKELINEDGSYYSKYKKVYILNSPQLIEDYKKRVCEAIEAYSHLTELYKDIFPNKTNRMAIDVLVQFPLVKWPAIVRLIETRKKNRK